MDGLQIVFKKIGWKDCLLSEMAGAFGDDGLLIKSEIQSGECELFHVKNHGYLVTRIENDELVLVAVVAVDTKPLFPTLVEIAKRNGLKTIRAHSNRCGMKKFLADLGFGVIETIYRKEL